MCGRFALSAKTDDIEKLVPNLKIREEIKPRYNISPSQNIASVLNTEDRELTYTKWGLIPSWSKDDKMSARMINARAETLFEKPAFRNLVLKRRCCILADGFYEWKKLADSKLKSPYMIRLADSKPFVFAGLWDSWLSPLRDRILSSTIITTEPNELMATIHDRMPVILTNDSLELWLSDTADRLALAECLMPYPAELMTAYPVSNYVNSPAFDNELCAEELKTIF